MKLLSKDYQNSYENGKICCICEEKLENEYLEDKCKVRDHFHYTAEYRGALHTICNIKYCVCKKFL